MRKILDSFEKRKLRVRKLLKEKSSGKLRLTVFVSNKHIYAQIIDDKKGFTLVSASTKDSELKNLDLASNINSAIKVGQLVAKRAIDNGILNVVFDRGGYIYHGKVKALADSAREVGLKF